MRLLQLAMLMTILGSSAAACGGKAAGPTASRRTEKPLYDRLGGMDAITQIVDDFVANVKADTRINAMFANADVENLKAKLADQICEASGGPCTYAGKSMKEAHVGMGVQQAHYDAMIEDLVRSLDKFDVPKPEQQELLAAIGAMKADIVSATQ